MERKLLEPEIVKMVTDFLINEEKWNWHLDKAKIAELHEWWVDIFLVWGKYNWERFFVECKWKSYAKNAKSVNKWTNWIFALWQIILRMNSSRIIKKGKNKWDTNRAYKYWLWLCWESAKVALRRIPKEIAQMLNLFIFSCNEKWDVIKFTPSQFWKEYSDSKFFK